MKFLENPVVSFLALFGLDRQSPLWLNAFFARYLTSIIELLILFIAVLYLIQYLMSYIDTNKIKRSLDKVPPFLAHVLAAVFGAITPFCTCSGVPIFTGLLRSGVRGGVAFSFLITSPLVNEIAFVSILAIFGMKAALIYTAFGLSAGIIGGMVISALHPEDDFTLAKADNAPSDDFEGPMTRSRFSYAWEMSYWVIKPVLPYLFIGVAIGVGVTMAVSPEWIASLSKENQFAAIPLAIIIGAPIYTSITAVIPVIGALVQKGMGTGLAFALIMSIGGMSFPEWALLGAVMKRRLLFIFIAVTAFMILLVSYVFAFMDVANLL